MEDETEPLGYPKPNKKAIAKSQLINTQKQNNTTRDLLLKLEEQAKKENNQFLVDNINELFPIIMELNLRLQVVIKSI